MFVAEFKKGNAEAFLVYAIADAPGSSEKKRQALLVFDSVIAAIAKIDML